MSATTEKTMISLALDCVNNLLGTFGDDVKKRFKARARDMPTELFTKGFAYMITLTAARSNASLVEVGLRASRCADIMDRLSGSRGLSEEEYGYAIYGAIILYILKQAGIISGSSLSDVIKSSLNDPTIDQHAILVVEWIKRLAEAYIT